MSSGPAESPHPLPRHLHGTVSDTHKTASDIETHPGAGSEFGGDTEFSEFEADTLFSELEADSVFSEALTVASDTHRDKLKSLSVIYDLRPSPSSRIMPSASACMF